MNFAEESPKFNFKEFNQRWLKARISALKGIQPDHSPLGESENNHDLSLEANRVAAYFSQRRSIEDKDTEQRKDTLLKEVFDNSRKLALSYSKHLGMTFELQDFQDLLSTSGIPCVHGEWSSRLNARILKRKGCDFCSKTGSDACDYWREAMDGVVIGLGEKERLARHGSVRHGDDACIDVFFTEASRSEEDSLAWGPLPAHMALELLELAAYFQSTTRVDIDLKGFREGVLYFEFASSTDLLCGNSNLLTQKFINLVREKFPGLILKDVTPQAVLGTTGG